MPKQINGVLVGSYDGEVIGKYVGKRWHESQMYWVADEQCWKWVPNPDEEWCPDCECDPCECPHDENGWRI